MNCRTTTHLRATLLAAVDHFAASNALVQGPPLMYAAAALIRGCIEASATVVWLLNAETMIEHLERVALLDLKSVRERHEYIGDRHSAAHDTERELIRAWATGAGVAPAKLTGRGQTIEQVVRFAGDRLSDRATLVDLAPAVMGCARPALGDVRRRASPPREARTKRPT